MCKILRVFLVTVVTLLSSWSVLSDDLFLQKLSDAGVELSGEQLALIEDIESIEDIVAALAGSSMDVAFLQAVVTAAVQAHPDSASAIVSGASLQAPAAAGAIASAAISASPSTSQAVVTAIVKAAVTASPAQAEAVRASAIAVAPAQATAINAAVDSVFSPQNPSEDSDDPSPSA